MYTQIITNAENENFRFSFVQDFISAQARDLRILDIGAGTKPFQKIATESGLRYFSHDFEKYEGKTDIPGLQSSEWPMQGYDIVCDIESLPNEEFDLAICTEVLEHVPNPVLALQSMRRTLRAGGKILITVPLSSRIHQAPYYFSSGLSPWWFEKHCKSSDFEIEYLYVVGDFVDQYISETRAFFDFLEVGKKSGGFFAAKFLLQIAKFIRKKLPDELLQSGGLGVYCVLTAT
jgi:SAM-dependent methyltransferase